jgi:hypothetical protein
MRTTPRAKHTAGITITINNDEMGAVSNSPIDNEAHNAPATQTAEQISSAMELTTGETWFRCIVIIFPSVLSILVLFSDFILQQSEEVDDRDSPRNFNS